MKRLVMVGVVLLGVWLPALALHAEARTEGAAVTVGTEPLPPRSWAPDDPADSLWRAAREAITRDDHAAAATIYRRIRTEPQFSASVYRAPSFYWEAFSRHRMGSVADMRTARDVLRDLRAEHPDYPQMAEVERLAGRIDADLAARGDAQAAQRTSALVSEALEQPNARQAQQVACPDQEMRLAALEALIHMPAETAMPLLTQVMGRQDACNTPLRRMAVFLIAQKAGDEAGQVLLDAARTDPDSEVREQAVFWLSQVDSEATLLAIEEILGSSTDAALTEQAIFALSQHRSPRAASLLREIAGQEGHTMETRRNAIFWLGQQGEAEAGDFLRDLYESLDEDELKEGILFALSQSGGANGEFLLRVAMDASEPVEARKQALFWAAQSGSLPLEGMSEMYRGVTDREMKEQIIFAISQSGSADAVVPLIEIARAETDVDLKKTIIFWIGQSRDPRAVAFISQLIGG